MLAFLLTTHSLAQVVINTVAGTGTAAYSGDTGPATAADINTPYGVAVDVIGNVYFTDYANNRIRKIDTFGNITTVAGTGVPGFTGDGGPATAATLKSPRGIAIDGAGNVLFTDYANNRIRKINTSTGIISTIVGNGLATFSGDGGPASAACINYAWGLAVDPAGNIYIADQNNCRIRKINTAGIISTFAGNGFCFISGDGGPATAARLQLPLGVACDGLGNVYVADYGNNRIRKIDGGGIISTIAGSPTYGFSGDGGPSTASQLYYPMGIAADAAGNILICDVNNSRIRKINTSGIISTIAGNGVDGYSGDGGLPTSAQINRATGVAFGPGGKIYIADNNNNRIRILHSPAHAPYFVYGHLVDSTFCPTETLPLDTLLGVFDADTGQTETWSVVSGPYHGVVVGSYATTSTGGIVYPLGLSYTPGTGYSGSDSFIIRVTDGTLSDTTHFRVTILSTPFAGVINGVDTLCPGDTLTFTDTTSGGTWSSGNTAILTVGATGLVTGVAPGITLLTYTYTNPCGTATATRPVRVSANCNVSVHPLFTQQHQLRLFPNPNTGQFTVSLSSPLEEEVRYSITDVVGRTVREFSSSTNEVISVQLNGAKGIYFITAGTGHGRWQGKICTE